MNREQLEAVVVPLRRRLDILCGEAEAQTRLLGQQASHLFEIKEHSIAQTKLLERFLDVQPYKPTGWPSEFQKRIVRLEEAAERWGAGIDTEARARSETFRYAAAIMRGEE